MYIIDIHIFIPRYIKVKERPEKRFGLLYIGTYIHCQRTLCREEIGAYGQRSWMRFRHVSSTIRWWLVPTLFAYHPNDHQEPLAARGLWCLMCTGSRVYRAWSKHFFFSSPPSFLYILLGTLYVYICIDRYIVRLHVSREVIFGLQPTHWPDYFIYPQVAGKGFLHAVSVEKGQIYFPFNSLFCCCSTSSGIYILL